MTVANTSITAGPYTGNDVTTSFPFDFELKNDNELEVYRTDLDGVITLMILATDYTITGTGDGIEAGSVETVTPLPAGFTLYVVANYEDNQQTAIRSQTAFHPAIHENLFDRFTYLIQQMNNKFFHSIAVPISEHTPELILPSATARADKYLTFDEFGNIQTIVDTGGTEYANSSKESSYNSEASKLTSASHATEAEDVLVKTYAKNGTGGYTPTDTALYSSLHHGAKAAASAGAAASSETNAAASAGAAASSETNAAGSAGAAGTSETNAAASAGAAGTSETNAADSANTAQLLSWEAEAVQMTADSYATEAIGVFVKSWTSDGDGTFTAVNTTEYSALHWAKYSDSTRVQQTSTTGSAIIPIGSTAQRDVAPVEGYFRANSTLGRWEGYLNGLWGLIGGGATGGGSDEVFVQNSQIVTTDYTVPSGKNAESVGPITVNAGVTVTLSTGSNWVIL